jgi:hypothetical protein
MRTLLLDGVLSPRQSRLHPRQLKLPLIHRSAA